MGRTHGSDWLEHIVVSQIDCSNDEWPVDIECEILVKGMLDHRERRGYC